jgi:hypothetical protein
VSRVLQNSWRALVVGTLVILGTAGCTAASSTVSGSEYLSSLKSSHKLDSKAAKVCTEHSGTPATKPTVAANSTLEFVRKLQKPGYAAQMGDSALIGNKQGYAAICLMKFMNYGKLTPFWTYYLPSGDSGAINAG